MNKIIASAGIGFVLLIASMVSAIPPDYNNPSVVSVDAEAGFSGSFGQCNPIDGDDDTDVWAFLSSSPGYTKANVAAVRYVKITSMDLPTGTPTNLTSGVVGLMIGGVVPGNAFFDPIPLGSSLQVQIQRPRDCGLRCGDTAYPYPNGGPVPLSLYANGDDRYVCVVAYF